MLNRLKYSMPHKVPFCLILLFTLFSKNCIVPYEPEYVENEEAIIVSGTITDQPGMNTIKLATSFPVKEAAFVKPLQGCTVWISDEMGKIDTLEEITRGTYGTDSVKFRGQAGKIYTLHIRTNKAYGNLNIESYPMEMIAVPEIDSIYYEKRDYILNKMPVEGCDIYLDTHDMTGNCSFYRWEYSETWEFQLPFDVKYKVCWINEDSKDILIKNSAVLENRMVERFPIKSIKSPVDRLKIKYSLLVRQYSLSEDEYLYWDRVRNISEQVGNLYDLIPAAIPNNIYCIENPDVKILGYFSVSATRSKRIFIKDNFKGQNGIYAGCIADTLYEGDARVNPYWVLFDRSNNRIPYKVITYDSTCADCRSRGTDIKPSFWDDDK
jgi:hypothetical protein